MNGEKSCIGEQTIGCGVSSCRYNGEGRYCELHRIEVRPCKGCGGSGKADEESFCGSYSQR